MIVIALAEQPHCPAKWRANHPSPLFRDALRALRRSFHIAIAASRGEQLSGCVRAAVANTRDTRETLRSSFAARMPCDSAKTSMMMLHSSSGSGMHALTDCAGRAISQARDLRALRDETCVEGSATVSSSLFATCPTSRPHRCVIFRSIDS